MYQRPDGLYEKSVTINGQRILIRAKSEKEIFQKIASFQEKEVTGRTFKEVAEEWQEEHFKDLSPKTASGYKAPFERSINAFGDTPIKGIMPQDLKAFIDKFAAKGWVHKTVTNQLLILNMIFEYAGITDGLLNNPMAYVKVPKGLQKKSRELPSDTDIKRVKENVGAPFGLFAYFVLYTGCRRGEALAIQFKDIDRVGKKINIDKSVHFGSNSPAIKEPKTKAGRREIPLLDILAEKIPNGKDDDYLFGGKEPLHESHFARNWKEYANRTEIDCTPHQLRHAYATMLYEAGVERKDAQELMGHSDIHTTENIYTHISKTQQSRTSQRLNDFTLKTQ